MTEERRARALHEILEMLTEARRLACVEHRRDPIGFQRADAAAEAVAAVLDWFGYTDVASAAIRRGEQEAASQRAR